MRDMGAMGAALGIGGAHVLVYLFIMWPAGLWLVKGTWPVFIRQTLIPGLAPFAAAMLGCLAYIQVFPITGWLGFFVGCGLSAFIYGVVVFGACLDPVDRLLMGRAGRKIRSKLFKKRDSA